MLTEQFQWLDDSMISCNQSTANSTSTLNLTLSKCFMIQIQDLHLSYFCLHSQLVLLGSLNVTSLNSTIPTPSICNADLTVRTHQICANCSSGFLLYWILVSGDNQLPTKNSTTLSLQIFASELTKYFNDFSTSGLMPVLHTGCSTHWCHKQWLAAFSCPCSSQWNYSSPSVVVVHPCCREGWYAETANKFLVAPNPTLSPVMPCNIKPTTLRHEDSCFLE
jgi:hypothetical protein